MEAPKFGDDLIIDSADEEFIECLPEIERESVLSNRYDQLQKYREWLRLQHKYGRSTKGGADSSDSEVSEISTGSPSRRSPVNEPMPDSSAEKTSILPQKDALLPVCLTRSLLHAHYLILPAAYRNKVLNGTLVAFQLPGRSDTRVVGVVESVEGPSNHTATLKVSVPQVSDSMVVGLSSVYDTPCTFGELVVFVEATSVSVVRAIGSRSAISRKVKQLEKAKSFTWDTLVAQQNQSGGLASRLVPGAIPRIAVRQLVRSEVATNSSNATGKHRQFSAQRKETVDTFTFIGNNLQRFLDVALAK